MCGLRFPIDHNEKRKAKQRERKEKKKAWLKQISSGIDLCHLYLSQQSDGTLLATGSYDGFARIWTEDGKSNNINYS